MTYPQETVNVDLSGTEREVLNRGLIEWGGAAHCTEAMARPSASQTSRPDTQKGAGSQMQFSQDNR